MIPKTEGYKRPKDKLETLKEVAVRDYKQHLDEVSSRINGAVSKTIVDGAVRDALEAGVLERTKTSPTFRLASGVAAGLSPIGTKATSPVEKETERIRKSSGAYKVGKVAGEIGSFTLPYVGAAEKVGAAVTKLPAVAKMGKTGQRIAKSVATDLAVGVPLNTNYAVNKEGLRGKEAAKSVAINTGVDLALGGVAEAVPTIAKAIKAQIPIDVVKLNNEHKSYVRATTKHTAEQRRIIKDYFESAEQGIINFVNKVRNLQKPSAASRLDYDLGDISERIESDGRQLLGFSLKGFGNNLKGNAINHIDIRHGPNGTHDTSMALAEDIARMKWVLKNYDNVELVRTPNGTPKLAKGYYNSDGTRAKMLRFSKKIDGMYYVVEAAPDSKDKKLQLISTYIGK